MRLPKLDLSALPDLDVLTGLFGSFEKASRMPGHDDSIVLLATLLYEASPPGGGII